MMILKELEHRLDELFLKSRAESWDNVGLQTGNLDNQISSIMVTLDINREVIDQALKKNIDMIATHHPLIFDPLKNITDHSCVGSMLLSLIKEGIAVYSAHTNYDIMADGLAAYYTRMLKLEGVSAIQPTTSHLYKLVIFVPEGHQEKVRQSICQVGGGKLGDYSCCTFNSKGQGTFLPHESAKPFLGEVGKLSFAEEVRIECIIDESRVDQVIEAALAAHPYQQPAYDLYRLENTINSGGLGIKGHLKQGIQFKQLLGRVREKLEINNFRWSADKIFDTDKKINTVAVVWGSANSFKDVLASMNSEVVIVGEMGYHNVCDIIGTGKAVIELGHGNSEKWAAGDIYRRLKDYFKQETIDMNLNKFDTGYMGWRYYIG